MVRAIDCISKVLAELHAFLGIIGGLLSYGPQGFVIGPMAVSCLWIDSFSSQSNVQA